MCGIPVRSANLTNNSVICNLLVAASVTKKTIRIAYWIVEMGELSRDYRDVAGYLRFDVGLNILRILSAIVKIIFFKFFGQAFYK